MSSLVDIGTATLMVADVSSDVYIARTYYMHATEHHEPPIFFMISTGIMVTSSGFGLLFSITHLEESASGEEQRWLRFIKGGFVDEFLSNHLGEGTSCHYIFYSSWHFLWFLAVLPLGLVLPIVIWFRGRFIEVAEADLLEQIQKGRERIRDMEKEFAEVKAELLDKDNVLAERMRRMKASSVALQETSELILNPLQHSRPEVQDLLKEFEEHRSDLNERKRKQSVIEDLMREVEHKQTEVHSAALALRKAQGVTGVVSFSQVAMKRYQDACLAEREAYEEQIKAEQDLTGIFRSQALGCWVSGYHLEQCMLLSKKLVEVSNSGVSFLNADLQSADSPHTVKKRLDMMIEAEKHALMAKIEDETGDGDEDDDEVARMERWMKMQEEIVARFIAQVKPAIDRAQNDMAETQLVLNQFINERNQTAKPYLNRLQTHAGTDKSHIRADLAKAVSQANKNIEDIQHALMKKANMVRNLQRENGIWESVLSGARDKVATDYKDNQLSLQGEKNNVLSLEINYKIATHLPFFVETVVEAVPQSLTQTSALVIYGHRWGVSYISVFSIAMSIGSIMSKVYVACTSKITQVFWYKFCCGCHDVALMFYTISAMFHLRRDSSEAVHVPFLTRPVDEYSAVWCWQAFLLACLFLVCGWSFCIAAVTTGLAKGKVRDSGDEPLWYSLLMNSLVFLLYLVILVLLSPFLLLPAMIMTQLVRLFAFCLYTMLMERDTCEHYEGADFLRASFAFLTEKAAKEREAGIETLKWALRNDDEPTEADLNVIHAPTTRLQRLCAGCTTFREKIYRLQNLVLAARETLAQPHIIKSLYQIVDEDSEDDEEACVDSSSQQPRVGIGKRVFVCWMAMVLLAIFLVWGFGVVYSMVYPVLSYSISLFDYIDDGTPLDKVQTFLFVTYYCFFFAAMYLHRTVLAPYLSVLFLVADEVLWTRLESFARGGDGDDSAVEKVREDAIRRLDREDMDRLFDSFFCEEARRKFIVEQRVGMLNSCKNCCSCCFSFGVHDEYEVVTTQDEVASTAVLKCRHGHILQPFLNRTEKNHEPPSNVCMVAGCGRIVQPPDHFFKCDICNDNDYDVCQSCYDYKSQSEAEAIVFSVIDQYADYKYELGERVNMRDRGGLWKEGSVSSTDPTEAIGSGWHYVSVNGNKWHYVVPYGVITSEKDEQLEVTAVASSRVACEDGGDD